MNGHGGSREGAGRKTKAEEMQLPALIEEVIGDVGKRELITKIYTQAMQGSFAHQQLIMQYTFGKPQDKIDLTSKGNEIFSKEIVLKDYADKS